MGRTVEIISAVDAEIDALPVRLRAWLVRLLKAIENVGLQALRAPHVKHLEGKLWEPRARANRGIARRIYVTATERRVVVPNIFVEKSRKTPRQALATAKKRMKQVTHDEAEGLEEAPNGGSRIAEGVRPER